MSKPTLQDIIQVAGYNDKEPPKDFHYYGTVVSEDKENHTYEVSINRDENVTVKAARLAGAQVGDVVMVTVMSNGYATVTGRIGGDRDALKAAAKADRAAEMADAVVSDIEAANSRIDGVEGDYTILSQDVANYKIENDTAVGNIFTRTTDIKKDLDDSKLTINEHSTAIQSINKNVSSMGREISSQGERLSLAESKIEQTPDQIAIAVSGINPVNYSGLVRNGSAQMKDNTNFEYLTYDRTVSYGSSGSFTHANGTLIDNSSKELIPISPGNTYTCYCDTKSKNGVARNYLGLVPYDIDKYTIYPWHYMFMPNTTTTLAADLKDGDTVIKFTSLANWNISTGTRQYQRGIILWNYVNSKNYKFPKHTYSRNVWHALYTDDSKVNKSANTITLASPWKYGLVRKGTEVSQSNSGGNYLYLRYNGSQGPTVPTTWARYSKIFSGVITDGKDPGESYVTKGKDLIFKFPSGTEYVSFLTILNVDRANDQVWITNMTLKDDTTNVESRSEFKVETDRISSTVSTKIGKNEVISSINQTAESVKIKASRIEIDGNLIVGKKDLAGYATTTALNTVSNNLNTVSNKLSVKDTRHDNQNPLWYMTNYPRQSVIEFKYCGNIGVPAKEAYCYLRTDVPWPDASGGYPKQTAEVGNKQYVRVGTSNTTWGAWEDWSDYMTFSSTEGLTIASNRVGATASKVNIKSDGIRIYGTGNAGLQIYNGTTLAATFTTGGVTLYNNNTTVSEFKNGLIRLYTKSPLTYLTQLRLDKYGLRIGYSRSDGSIDDLRAGFVFNSDDTMNVQAFNFIVGNNVKVPALRGVVSMAMGEKYMLRAFPIYNKNQTEIINYGTQLGNDDKETRIFGSKIWASKTITGSDERVKKDFRQLDRAKDFINSLKTFSYKWNPDSELWYEDEIPDEYIHFGVSAQNVIEEMKKYDMDPEVYSLVDTSSSYYGVAYSDFIPLLIRTVQDQQKEIDELRQIINTVKMEVI